MTQGARINGSLSIHRANFFMKGAVVAAGVAVAVDCRRYKHGGPSECRE
jgi:hypothetical protein